ncbi:hypothetical protein E4T51_02949 [Aureobasidium sp. EXF-12344]|nr:hypothetical protein E4T51_02949 [Aureobasidium sp. EXF-12344]
MSTSAPPRGALMRTASAEQQQVSLQHPSPGLESLQGAYIKNVERLEQSAEEMSQGGSDIGDEIRRMKQEQDRASLRSSSIASESPSLSHSHSQSHSQPREGRQQSIDRVISTRSRNHSTSSYSNSIVDVNNHARWGGYSPGGYITSPAVSRVSSFHRPSGMPEPVQEGRPLDSPLASPTSYSSPRRQPSHYSLAPTVEDAEMLEYEQRHINDADKTPEPEHQEWDKGSRRLSDLDELSHYSHDAKPHYDEQDEQSMYSRDQQSHYSHPDQQSHYSQPDQQSHYSQPDQQDNFSQDDRHLPQQEQYSHQHKVSQEEQWQQEAHDLYQQAADQQGYNDFVQNPPDRPPTTDTFRDARSLFKDFDGVHYSPANDEEGSGNLRQRVSQMSRQPRAVSYARPMSYAQPPPNDGMVYYPAPVPRMLNLPKRLSQLPSANQQAQRRSQVLSAMPLASRQSAPWLADLKFNEEEPEEGAPQPGLSPPQAKQQRRSMMDLRNSRMSMANLPPQLRASAFFDNEGQRPPTEVRVQSASAVATLDSILAASVNAPVNVFTDHPFAGNTGQDIYAQERTANRRSATLSKIDMMANNAEQKGHDRSISAGTMEKPALSKRNSMMTVLTDFGGRSEGKKLKKRNSKMSLMTDLDMNDTGDTATEFAKSRPASVHFGNLETEEPAEHSPEPEYTEEEAEEVAGDRESVYNDEQDMKMPFFAQPTTLLAELQARKAHQKSRNRAAADAFPDGMHSTLLQMDAVKQVEKNKKKKLGRTKLAWEDPGVDEDEEDEDVPLGVLYPTKGGLINRGKKDESDWDRPLGLMEKREFEDNEPLSSRRFRLKGVPAADARRIREEMERQRREAALPPPEAVPLPGEDSNDEEGANEPLGHRLRRLKQKQMLDVALGDVAEDKRKSTAFSEDILSTFGGITGAKAKTPEPEEETLGQRRARLQREREAEAKRGDTSDPPSVRTVRPPLLRSSSSLANLLAAHPVFSPDGPRSANANAGGSLLADAARAEEEARRKLRERNAARSTSYNRLTSGMPPHLVPQVAPPLLSSQSTGAVPQYFNPQTLQPQQAPMMYPMAAGGMPGGMPGYGYAQPPPFLQPTAQYGNMMFAGAGGFPGYPQMQMQMMPMQQQQLMPLQQQQAYAHTAQMQLAGGIHDPNNVARRDLIDRWRQSIMH